MKISTAVLLKLQERRPGRQRRCEGPGPAVAAGRHPPGPRMDQAPDPGGGQRLQQEQRNVQVSRAGCGVL